MTHRSANQLTANELAVIEATFHRGASEASAALAAWIGKPSVVEVDSVEQLPLEEATGLLATGDEPVCFCSTEIGGCLAGEMILVFDDASGLALADMLLAHPHGTAQAWTEMATSAALETTNILCCAYLNSLSRSLGSSAGSPELLPAPPRFSRDYGESLLECAFMGQAIASDQVILTRTRFVIDGVPLAWTLLFVPDAESMVRLPELIRAFHGRQ